MEKQSSYLLHHSCQFCSLPPCHESVALKPSLNTALRQDQKDTTQDPPPPHECNAARQRTQRQLSLHGINNTVVLPPPSSASSYCSPQQKSNPKYCAPLVDPCISCEWSRWGGCNFTCTMPWLQVWVEVVAYLL